MKRKLCAVLLIVAFVLNCVSCSHMPVPELSDEYLVGLDYGGSSWGMIYDCIDARVIIRTNRDVLVYMPTTSKESDYEETLEKVATFELTEEQYNAINEVLDREKLYNMRVESNTGVCDGSAYYLILYGKDGEIVKKCGAYMPTSENFMEIYKTVVNNIPRDKIIAVRDEYVKELEIKERKESDLETEQMWRNESVESRAKMAEAGFNRFEKGGQGARYSKDADKTTYIDTKSLLSEDNLYTWDNIVDALKTTGNGTDSAEAFVQTGDVSYRLIDCGNDGVSELCVEGQFNNEYGLHMIVSFVNYGLRIDYIGDSWERSGVSISDSGVIVSGGSAGATVHVMDYAYVDADGKYNFCYGITQSLPVFESMYVQKEGGELVSLSAEGLDTEHLGLNEYRFEDENGNSTYCYEYFVVDDDFNDITTEADYSDSFEFKKRFADLGIKTYTSAEIRELVDAATNGMPVTGAENR